MFRIPVRNIYYLLLYAWNRYEGVDIARVDVESAPDQPNLIAHILVAATRRVLRERLDRSYVAQSQEDATIRGQIDFSATIGRCCLRKGRVVSIADDLTVDNLLNRILKATIRRLANTANVEIHIRHNLRELCQRLAGVSDIRLVQSDFRQVQVHANNASYRILIDLCRLAFNNLVPLDVQGAYRFQEFVGDEGQLWRLFQDFVRNFYRAHLLDCEVGAERVSWAIDGGEPPDLLPHMLTDVTLRWHDATVVVDTKYYKDTVSQYRGRERLHSANLYQLYAYLRNMEPMGGLDACAAGVLLYPLVDRPLDERVRISGHHICAKTVDLSRPWPEIHEELLQTVAAARQDSRQPLLASGLVTRN